MRCDSCSHWKVNRPENNWQNDWEAEAVGFHKCLAARPRWVIQDEASEGVEWSGEEEGAFMKKRREALRAARAYVQDGSQYVAELVTAPDFFCALYHKRES